MNRDSGRQSAIILAVIGILPVVWLGLLIAPSVKGGLLEILPSLLTVFNDPFHIELCGDSLKTVLVLLLLYGMGIGIYLSTRRIWGGVKNTALRNGAAQKPLTKSTVKARPRKIS